jgi:hypothetical protein
LGFLRQCLLMYPRLALNLQLFHLNLLSAEITGMCHHTQIFLFLPWGDFLAPASEESWDRLRLTCSQPFTRHQSFGLAFLRVRSSLDTLADPVMGPSAPGSSGLSQVCQWGARI